jgi:hypothetical protein
MTRDAMLAEVAEQSKLPREMFVFYLHMGMGEIHWREEGDPIINRIKDRDIFYVRDIFSLPFFWCVFLPSVGCRVG